MNDIEFCKEYVKRIPRPLKTSSSMQMVKIVEDKILIPVDQMYDDLVVKELFERFSNYNFHGAFVYKFVRDNQELFVK